MSIETIGAVLGATATAGTTAPGYGVGLENTDNAQMTRGVSDTQSVPAAPSAGPGAVRAAGGAAPVTSGTDFASLLTGGLDRLQAVQSTSDDLALKAATGDLANVHDYMIASNEAQLATQLTVAVRNKAVEAFNEIMRMQI